MKILVLGSGGREHAIAWRAKASGAQVFLHPGNSGTVRAGIPNLTLVPLTPDAIMSEAKRLNIGLIVIGPETLLAQGYADKFRSEGFLVVGPSQIAAQLETSKIFAKEFMARAGIPTAGFQIIETQKELLEISFNTWPVVLKYDGLAQGKGVVICHNQNDVTTFAQRIWDQNEFGSGPHRLVVEECLSGKEISYIGLCDGETFLPLSSSTDYKRVGDGGIGPNTGGMGVVSPSPFLTETLEKKIQERIIVRTLAQLRKESLEYRGALYVGLMVTASGDPYVIEFNARFGDPETQAILLRFEGDFIDYLLRTAQGTLHSAPPVRWSPKTSIYVVGAAQGYPSNPKVGDPIYGIAEAQKVAQIFFSGVKDEGGNLVSAGGRVLGVGALGNGIDDARNKAYSAMRNLCWRGMHFRTDIGLTEDK